MTKQDLRKRYLEKRLTLSPKELEDISEKICNSIFSNFQLEGKKISIFLPIEGKKELNTYKIWEKAMTFDTQVAVPKTDMATLEMKHILLESKDQLEVVYFGIPEPKKGRVIAAEHFDYIFVPLLAIDRHGNRVGYGKGIYDRYLRKRSPRCKLIGLSHFDELAEDVEGIHENDVKLDMCITPNNIYRFD